LALKAGTLPDKSLLNCFLASGADASANVGHIAPRRSGLYLIYRKVINPSFR
jgi:hypothetical protein